MTSPVRKIDKKDIEDSFLEENGSICGISSKNYEITGSENHSKS